MIKDSHRFRDMITYPVVWENISCHYFLKGGYIFMTSRGFTAQLVQVHFIHDGL